MTFKLSKCFYRINDRALESYAFVDKRSAFYRLMPSFVKERLFKAPFVSSMHVERITAGFVDVSSNAISIVQKVESLIQGKNSDELSNSVLLIGANTADELFNNDQALVDVSYSGTMAIPPSYSFKGLLLSIVPEFEGVLLINRKYLKW